MHIFFTDQNTPTTQTVEPPTHSEPAKKRIRHWLCNIARALSIELQVNMK